MRTDDLGADLSSEEFDRLRSARSPQDWNRTMDDIIEARSGRLPFDWGDRVVRPGLLRRVKKTWSKPALRERLPRVFSLHIDPEPTV